MGVGARRVSDDLPLVVHEFSFEGCGISVVVSVGIVEQDGDIAKSGNSQMSLSCNSSVDCNVARLSTDRVDAISIGVVREHERDPSRWEGNSGHAGFRDGDFGNANIAALTDIDDCSKIASKCDSCCDTPSTTMDHCARVDIGSGLRDITAIDD